MYKQWGTVSMKKVRSAVSYIVPSVIIAKGNSGGPVLDEKYRVVAVASRGAKSLSAAGNTDSDSYGAIYITHIKKLLS